MSLGERVRTVQMGKRQGSQRSGKREMLGKFGGHCLLLICYHLVLPWGFLIILCSELFNCSKPQTLSKDCPLEV